MDCAANVGPAPNEVMVCGCGKKLDSDPRSWSVRFIGFFRQSPSALVPYLPALPRPLRPTVTGDEANGGAVSFFYSCCTALRAALPLEYVQEYVILRRRSARDGCV